MRRLLVLLLIFILAIPALPVKANYDDPWASVYSNWLYRRAITISNPNANDLTDFQVKITLDSTNFDFSKANTDGSDVRFADAQGNPLSYWIEKWDNVNEEAIIWVKVPSIPAGSDVTIYIYYGNPSAESESDGDSVFEFFDDFEDYTQNWNVDVGSATQVSDTEVKAWGGWQTSGLISKNTFSAGVIVEAKTKCPQDGGTGVGQKNINGGYVAFSTLGSVYDDPRARVVTGTSSVTIQSSTNFGGDVTTYHVQGYAFTTNKRFIGLWEGQQVVEWDASGVSDYNGDTFYITLQAYEYGRTSETDYQYYDWVRVRKYAEQEPTISVGSEEVNNPVTVTFDFKDDLGNTLNGVDVYIDGGFYGTFDSGDSVVVSAGTHTFLAQKQHYVDAQQTLDVQSDTTLTLTLDRQSYTVYFYAYDVNNQTIDNFKVYANGTLLGTFDSGDSATLKYGTYVFRFEKELYKRVTLQKLINVDGIIVNFTNIMLDNINLVTLYFYDASNNTVLNQVNVTVDGENKGLFDSGEVLQLVKGNHTLTFSKEGYENRTLSIEVLSDMTISVYLEAVSNETEIDINQAVNMTELVQNITANLSIEPINSYAKAFLDSGGSFGDTVVNAIKGDQLMKLILPQGLIFIITIIVLWQTQSPLAGLGGTIITWAMFLTLLDEKPNLTNSGVTFALVVFLVAWTLWDLFYNYSRET